MPTDLLSYVVYQV